MKSTAIKLFIVLAVFSQICFADIHLIMAKETALIDIANRVTADQSCSKFSPDEMRVLRRQFKKEKESFTGYKIDRERQRLFISAQDTLNSCIGDL